MRILFLLFSLLFVPLNCSAIEDAILVERSNRQELLCGIKCLFSALYYLNEETSISYSELLQSFPNAQLNGISLVQIKEFIEERTEYKTALVNYNESDILELGVGDVAFVLEERMPVSHIILKRPKNVEIHVIDPPNFKIIDKSEISKEKKPTLVLSRKKIYRETSKIFLKYLLLFLAATSFFVLSKIILENLLQKKRKKFSEQR